MLYLLNIIALKIHRIIFIKLAFRSIKKKFVDNLIIFKIFSQKNFSLAYNFS